MIVGYQASGFDLARQIAPTAAQVWISSTRDVSDQIPEDVKATPQISRFEPKDRQVIFEDGSKLWRVDHIIFCTGYKFSQPFTKAGHRARLPLFPDGPTIDNLYEHMVYKDNPSLAFVGMVQGGAPTFLIVQAQAALLSRLWAGRLSMKKQTASKTGTEADHNARHLLPYSQFMDYLLRLEKMCKGADQQRPKIGDADESNPPFKWTLELDWIRQNRREIREAFMKHPKDEQKTITSLEQLGFDVKISPSSANIDLVIPFLILHTAHFTEAHLDLLDAYFPSRHTKGVAFRGANLFEQVRMILAQTQRQLQPASRALFREGAERLLRHGLDRIQEAIANIEDREEDAARAHKGKKVVVKIAATNASLPFEQYQEKMNDTYTELFGNA